MCGKRFRIHLEFGGKYDNGHYFGTMKLPVEGTGKHVKVGKSRLGRHWYEVVRWTGKEGQVEYWECNTCFAKAAKDDPSAKGGRLPGMSANHPQALLD